MGDCCLFIVGSGRALTPTPAIVRKVKQKDCLGAKVIYHRVRHGPEVRHSSSHGWPPSGTAVGSDCSSGQNVKTSIANRVGITFSKNNKGDHITRTAKHLSTVTCIAPLNMQNSNSSTRQRKSNQQKNMASKNSSITNSKASLQPSYDASSLIRRVVYSNDAGGERSSGYEVGDDTCKISAQQNNIMRRQIYNGNILATKPAKATITQTHKIWPNKSSETFLKRINT